MRLLPAAALAWLFATVPAQAPAPANTAETFATGLANVRDTGARGFWKDAREKLNKLLEQHRDAPYCKERALELRDLIQQCDVRSQLPPLDPKTLIAGELLANNLTGSTLKVRYRPGQWQKDFQKQGDTVWVHPAFFTGAHEIELKGKEYPALAQATPKGGAPYAIFGADDRIWHSGVFGIPEDRKAGRLREWVPATIRRHEGEQTEVLDTKEVSPCTAGKPFTLVMQVTATQIHLLYNQRPILSVKRPKDANGQLGFGGWSEFDEVTIEGKAERSWLQGLIDKAQGEQLANLTAKWDAKAALPAWLLAASETAAAVSRGASPGGKPKVRSARTLPDRLGAEHMKNVDVVGELVQADQAEAALALLEGLDDAGLPRATRAFLLATVQFQLGRLDQAEKQAAAACAAAPDHESSREFHGRILESLGREDVAAVQLQEHLGRHAGHSHVRSLLARVLLALGRPADAKRVVDEGVAQGFGTDTLAQLQSTIRKAQVGPDWAKTFAHRTRNFEITSDIDRKTCEDAGKILEDGYQLYGKLFGPAPDSETRQFKVHLFSGETSYLRFAKDLWNEDAPSHTAGLYSQLLKHLLIWNLPSREEMLETVRHEGFHQYLDRLVRNAPSWFDEGHAEYFETARLVNGVWKLGTVRQDHLDVLRRGMVPVRRLLFLEPAEFYGEASALHYAQSWLLVHWLRHAGPDAAKRWKTLWEAMRGGATPAAAIESAFGAQLKGMDLVLQGYLDGLSR